MAENNPPAETATANANDSTTRGMPYYEKLRRDLREALQKKRAIDNALNNLEDAIFKTEERYLEETSSAGNIVKGFENYIKGATITGAGAGGAGNAARRKTAVSDADRIFSRSSQSFLTYRRTTTTAASVIEEGPISRWVTDVVAANVSTYQDSPAPTSAQLTPSNAPTPTSSFPSARESNHPTPGSTASKATSNKKRAATKDEDDTDSKPATKRGKITYGRE